MNAKDLIRFGVPLGEASRRAVDFITKFILGGGDKSRLAEEVSAIVAQPVAFVNDPTHPRFFGRDNDRMPSYGTEKSLSPREIEMVVDWIRQEWYTPKTAAVRK